MRRFLLLTLVFAFAGFAAVLAPASNLAGTGMAGYALAGTNLNSSKSNIYRQQQGGGRSNATTVRGGKSNSDN